MREVRTHPSYPHRPAAALGTGQGHAKGRVGVVREVGLPALLPEPELRCSSTGQRGPRAGTRQCRGFQAAAGPCPWAGDWGLLQCAVCTPTPEDNGQPATGRFLDVGLAESSWGQNCGLRKGGGVPGSRGQLEGSVRSRT